MLNYCPMTTQEAFQAEYSINIVGEDVPMCLGQLHTNPELPVSFLWMDQWCFIDKQFQAGEPFEIPVGGQVFEYFWLNIGSAAAGSDLDDLLIRTGREMPDKEGTYMLVFNVDKGYYVRAVEIY